MRKSIRKQDKSIILCSGLSCWGITTLLGLITLVATAYILTFQMGRLDVCLVSLAIQGKPLHIVNEKFLSLGLDSSVITDGFKNFNMTDPKLIKMMKYLSPAYLRIGGNQADQIIFCNNQKGENCILKYKNTDLFRSHQSYTLAGSDWLKLHKMANSANIDVIYDLNSLLRLENGSWNSENAQEMITFSLDHGLVLDWELGNEPNSYKHKFNTSVAAAQLGIDYTVLRSILNKYELYKSSRLVGPSTTRLRTKDIEEYFAEFLIIGSPAVSAITWHHYYFGGINATRSEFLDPMVFNYLADCITTVNSIVRDFLQLNKSIWLGETSSAWHSGAPGLSDRFIAGFIWTDKLGLSAQMGIDVVVRQSIFKGHYALLNDSYDPNPDWWLSILYKKLVGTSVIGTYCSGDDKIRLYAHCAKKSALWDHDRDKSHYSNIVVFGVNLQDKIGFIKMENLLSDKEVHVYEITSESSLFSRYVRLNGQILNMLPNLQLPDLKPKIIVIDQEVFTMPAYSIVFWVFKNTNVLTCVA